MGCCHYYAPADGKESAFSIDISSIVFGSGVLAELGEHAKTLGMTRVALYTDKRIRALPFFAEARDSLRNAGLTVAVYGQVKVEPTDKSFLEAARFATEGKVDPLTEVRMYFGLGSGGLPSIERISALDSPDTKMPTSKCSSTLKLKPESRMFSPRNPYSSAFARACSICLMSCGES